jgi:hypothetical protein
MFNKVFIIMYLFAIFSGIVPSVGLNNAMFAFDATATGITVFIVCKTVVGIAARIALDVINAKVLGRSATENCVINVAELYVESEGKVATIVANPGCNMVTSFPFTVAISVFEEVYTHELVLSAGFDGSVIVNGVSARDLFAIGIVPITGLGRLTTNVAEIVASVKFAVLA